MNSKKTRKEEKQKQKRLPLLINLSDHANMLHLTEGYVIHPPRDYIFSQRFRINGLSISHRGTTIRWGNTVDLSELQRPLSQIVFLGEREVQVYPDQLSCKPRIGKQLNQPCVATLTLAKRKTLRNIDSMQRSCREKNCMLIGVNWCEKQIHIEIPHFTKYTFEIDEDEELDQNSLLVKMKRKQAQRIVEDRKKQKQIVKHQPQISRTLTQKVQQHNQKMGHKVSRPILHGNGTIYNSHKLSNYQTCISFSKLQQTDREGKILQVLVNTVSRPDFLNVYIVNESWDIEVRFYLSLYLICFDFEACRFRFVGNGGNIYLKTGTPDLNQQNLYLKKWFQWVLNFQNQGKPAKSDLLSNLSLRKVEEHTYHFMKYGSFNDAQFLASIQDPYYRIDDSKRKLHPDLERIQVADQAVWKGWGWMTRVATFLWYYGNIDENNILRIMKEEGSSIHSLYFIMIWMFFGGRFYEVKDIPPNCFSFCWHLAQKQSLKMEKIFRNSSYYNQYRQRLFAKMLSQAPDSSAISSIYENEKHLQIKDKRALLRNFLQHHWQEPQYHHPEWEQIIWQLQAYNKYSNKQYFEAFKLFLKVQKENPSTKVEEMLVLLAGNEELLGSGDELKVQKVLRLMEECGEVQKKEWKTLIEWGKICIKGGTITENNFSRIEQMCNEILGKSTANKIMQSLFLVLQKEGLRHYLYNESFYRRLIDAYKHDQRKSTQLKLARLSL